ncbi:MAG: N-acetylmuramoyl-L-alanine amidase [Bacteroidetes bacterium]|jgi:N-acetylmuramoyl-L-alanine amidase|nr:N-acetylmuramoyl-L-alanine amidase [Bacteroidota bacterium]
MVGKIKNYLALTLLVFSAHFTEAQDYFKIRAKQGDGISVILNRYNLAAYQCNVDTFLAINNLKQSDQLQLAKTYKLPIYVYDYNDQSIRTTIKNNDYNLAVYIQQFNEDLYNAGLREFDYRVDKILWVPIHALHCPELSEINKINEEKIKTNEGDPNLTKKEENIDQETTKPLKWSVFPIFGKKHEKTPIYTTRLEGQVYYLISGHGGPDPGAIGKKDGHVLCEDEYAYDITLRFARDLLQHSATVYLITRDTDGIRDIEFLDADKDETVWYNQTIPLNQVRRLKQRTSKINELYAKHKKQGATIQRVVEIHIDSRYVNQKVDIFFYYYPGSTLGKSMANTMLQTIKSEYEEHQANRGYRGVVKSRDLHTLRESKPPVVYIELGNITNKFDQKRLLIVNNRQAIANWLTQGVLEENTK